MHERHSEKNSCKTQEYQKKHFAVFFLEFFPLHYNITFYKVASIIGKTLPFVKYKKLLFTYLTLTQQKMVQKYKWMLRFAQKKIYQIKKQVLFKTSHISSGWKLILLWAFVSTLSLFFPWIHLGNEIVKVGESSLPLSASFSGLLWNVGFLIGIILAAIIFSVFSIQKKEKLHFLSTIQFSDWFLSFYGSICIIILALHSFMVVKGLKFFSLHITFWKGISLCITGAIIILIGSIVLKKQRGKNIKWSYFSDINGAPRSEESQETKDNMKLPF